MLTEERHAQIVETVNKNGSAKIGELCQLLNSSESTIRRDLNVLAKMGKITKVHGGAIATGDVFAIHENDVMQKNVLCTKEKKAIAKCAASQVMDEDFVFIDAGTTTEKMIDYLPNVKAMFVTNGFTHAKRLAQRGFRVFIPAGEIKTSTEAIVGEDCITSLLKYNFTKCFMGVNGISLSGGLSTHDTNEAAVKRTVISLSKNVYILGDYSKFDKITPVKFSDLSNVSIITDQIADKKYLLSNINFIYPKNI